jgi:hypothetical protein
MRLLGPLLDLLPGGRTLVVTPGSASYLAPEERVRRLIRRPNQVQRERLEWACELVGPLDAVWDLGASDGVFAVAAAILAGRYGNVLAFESPGPQADALRRLARRLGRDEARFDLFEGSLGDQLVAGEAPGSAPEQVDFDFLLANFPRPTLVRIDQHVHDVRIWKGARRLLDEARPALLIEVPPPCREEVTERLKAFSYQLFDAELNPGDRFHLLEAAARTLAIPGRALSG